MRKNYLIMNKFRLKTIFNKNKKVNQSKRSTKKRRLYVVDTKSSLLFIPIIYKVLKAFSVLGYFFEAGVFFS